MNKQNVVSGGRLLFKRVLPKWLVALALGLQIAVVIDAEGEDEEAAAAAIEEFLTK